MTVIENDTSMRLHRALALFAILIAAACQRESPLSKLPVAKARRTLGTVSLPASFPARMAFRSARPIRWTFSFARPWTSATLLP